MKFLHFADLHIDANTRGKRDPDTGVHIRVMDTVNNLDYLIDFAIQEKVDAVIFSGDAFHHERPLQEHKELFQKRIKYLANSGIPFIAVIGNHDKIQRSYFKHPLRDFEVFEVENIYVSYDPEILEFDNFIVYQIPWQYGDIKIEPLESDKPIIVNAHCTIWGITYDSGVETSEVNLGRDFVLSVEELEFADYVALGHIHREQTVHEDPPMIYPGNVEINTWGEIGDKYFIYGEFEGKNIIYKKIPFETRKRYDLEFSVESNDELFSQIPEIDPEAMYRIRIRWKDYNTVNMNKLDSIMKNAFEWKVEESRPSFRSRRRDDMEDLRGKSPLELVKTYFDRSGIEFDEEFEELFLEVEKDVVS